MTNREHRPRPPHLQRRADDGFLEIEDLTRPVDWAALMGCDAPLEIEIGCGNGRFLRRAAESRPDHAFLGIERSLSYARKAVERVEKYALDNVKVLRGDAKRVLADRVAPDSVEALHVYFIDPWPKKRHAKRRLFQKPFLDTVHRIVRPGGRVYVKVDLLWYIGDIMGRFEVHPGFRVVANGIDTDPDRDLYEITGFEQKALRRKGAVYWMAAENRRNEA